MFMHLDSQWWPYMGLDQVWSMQVCLNLSCSPSTAHAASAAHAADTAAASAAYAAAAAAAVAAVAAAAACSVDE